MTVEHREEYQITDKLFQISRALNTAQDEEALIKVLGQPAVDAGAGVAVLVYYEMVAIGSPSWAEIVGINRVVGQPSLPVGARLDLSALPLLKDWLLDPKQLLLVSDISQETRLDSNTQTYVKKSGMKAFALISLTSLGRLIGSLVYGWEQPHEFTPLEREFYSAMIDLVGPCVEIRRMLGQKHRVISDSLFAISRGLNTARNEHDLLEVLSLPARDSGASGAYLAYFEIDSLDEPDWLEIVAVWQKEQPPKVPIGSKFRIKDFEFSREWLMHPQRPKLISDIMEEQKVDQSIRELIRSSFDTRALAIIPLRSSERWIGQLIMWWREPHEFDLFEKEIYTALIGLASPAVENRQLLARVQKSNDELERRVIRRTAELSRLTRILESTSDFVAITLPNAQPQYVNSAGRKMLGLKRDDEVAISGIKYPSWAEEIIRNQAIPQAIRDGIWKGETALLSKTGKEIAVSQVIMSHKSNDGELEYLSTIMRDITKRKKAEEELRIHRDSLEELVKERTAELLKSNRLLQQEVTDRKKADNALKQSEEKFAKAFHSSPGLMAICRMSDDIIVDINSSFTSILGYQRDELIGHRIQDLCLWVNAEQRDILVERAKSGQPLIGVEANIQDKYGGKRLMLISAEIINLGDDPYLLAVASDFTERSQSEKELQRLRSLLSNIIDSMPSLIVGVDAEGRVNQWNREAEKATSISADKAHGKLLEEVFPFIKDKIEMVNRAIRSNEIQKMTKVESGTSNEKRYSDITVYPLVANGVDGAVIRIDEVTERVRMEELMIQSEKMLSVGGLAAGMAHEINNPLAGILQNVQVIRNRLTADLAKNRITAEACGTRMESIRSYIEERELIPMFDAVTESGMRASKIVHNMLSFSRKSDTASELCDLRELLDKTIELANNDYDLKKKYDFRAIRIVRQYAADIPNVRCDASKIQQVFLNVLKNGAHALVKAMNETETPCITLRIARDGEMARVEIEDNGHGMDEATRKRVFEPFFTTKDIGSGTGLGLSVSFFIITENHNGRMEVVSSPGKGANFIIYLPLQKSESN